MTLTIGNGKVIAQSETKTMGQIWRREVPLDQLEPSRGQCICELCRNARTLHPMTDQTTGDRV